MATRASDELAERRARRDGASKAALDAGPVGLAHLRERLAAAEHEVAALQARLGRTTAERDRVAALAETRRADWLAAGRRELALRGELADAQRELADVRDRLVARTTSEAHLRVEATGLHARIHALRAQAAGHDARVGELATVVEALGAEASAARADADARLAARERAEAALDDARARIAALEGDATELRAELETLHSARDRTLNAEAGIRAARAAERDALRLTGERLLPSRAELPADPIPDLAAELSRAAERLRARPPLEEGDVRAEAPVPAVAAAPASRPALAPVVSPPVPALAVPAPPARALAAAAVRRLVRGLRGRRR